MWSRPVVIHTRVPCNMAGRGLRGGARSDIPGGGVHAVYPFDEFMAAAPMPLSITPLHTFDRVC